MSFIAKLQLAANPMSNLAKSSTDGGYRGGGSFSEVVSKLAALFMTITLVFILFALPEALWNQNKTYYDKDGKSRELTQTEKDKKREYTAMVAMLTTYGSIITYVLSVVSVFTV